MRLSNATRRSTWFRRLIGAAIAGGLLLALPGQTLAAFPSTPAVTATFTPALVVDGTTISGTQVVAASASSVIGFTGSQVDLSWGANTDATATFEVRRWDAPSQTYSTIASLAANTLSYSDTSLGSFPTNRLSYQVCATTTSGTACNSSPASVSRPPSGAGFAASAAWASGSPSVSNGAVSGSGAISLAWTPPTAPPPSGFSNPAGFSIWRFDSAAQDWVLIAVAGPGASSYTDPTTYASPASTQTYRLCAISIIGSNCASSASVRRPSIAIGMTGLNPTAALSSALSVNGTELTGTSIVTATNSTPTSYTSTVTLSWLGNALDGTGTPHTGFSIGRFNSALQRTDVIDIAADPAAISYAVPVVGAFPTGSPSYQVCAINLLGRNCASDTGSPSAPLPLPPANMAVGLTNTLSVGSTLLSGSDTVASSTTPTVGATAAVSWATGTTSHAGFLVQRFSPVNLNWSTIGYAGPGATSFSDSGPGTYPSGYVNYRLCSVSQLNAQCRGAGVGQPGVPTGFAASADNSSASIPCVATGSCATNVSLASLVSGSKVSLTWDALSSNQAGFTVWRWDPTTRNYARIGAAGPTAASFLDASPPPGRAASYRLCSVNVVGSPCTTTIVRGPAQPTGLAMTDNGSTITLSWSALSSSQAAFAVFRWSGTAWTRIAILTDPTATTYTDSAPTAANRYYFIAAFNQFGVQNSIRAPSVP